VHWLEQKGPLLSHEQSSLLAGHTLSPSPSSSIRGRSSSRNGMLPSAASLLSSTGVLPAGTNATLMAATSRGVSPAPATPSKRSLRDLQRDVDAVRALR
jgi:hypothetical protein